MNCSGESTILLAVNKKLLEMPGVVTSLSCRILVINGCKKKANNAKGIINGVILKDRLTKYCRRLKLLLYLYSLSA